MYISTILFLLNYFNITSNPEISHINPIPLIHFQIDFVGGTISNSPAKLNVNGIDVQSSTGSSDAYWHSYVNYTNSFGIFNFNHNQLYKFKGVGVLGIPGNKKLMCIKFNPMYKSNTDIPRIEYNRTTRLFKVINSGNNCIIKFGTACFDLQNNSNGAIEPKKK